MRPDVVLFGETPHGLDWILPYLDEVDIFIAVGTSGTVYPAADFVKMATAAGAPIRILVNKEAPIASRFGYPMMDEESHSFNVVRLGNATSVLPMVLKEVGKLIDNIH